MKKLLLLDRDGVLNEICIDAEHGTIDSPLHPTQVKIIPGVVEALKKLSNAGWEFVIVSNQPGAAKGKTTRANLEAVHAKVLNEIESNARVKFLGSYICWHRAEDGCECRKPKTGLLKQAFNLHPEYTPKSSWMIGDGVTDIEAGHKMGLKTVYLGPKKCDALKIFEGKGFSPDHWAKDLMDASHFLL